MLLPGFEEWKKEKYQGSSEENTLRDRILGTWTAAAEDAEAVSVQSESSTSEFNFNSMMLNEFPDDTIDMLNRIKATQPCGLFKRRRIHTTSSVCQNVLNELQGRGFVAAVTRSVSSQSESIVRGSYVFHMSSIVLRCPSYSRNQHAYTRALTRLRNPYMWETYYRSSPCYT
jgi:hypothetical protein